MQACYSGKNRYYLLHNKKQNNMIDIVGVMRLQKSLVQKKTNRYYLLDNIK